MSTAPDTPLIGRTAEITRLERAFERARDGSGAVVLLAGEAGVGKTRLAEHVLARAPLEVRTGRAREDAPAAYGPITAALRDHLRSDRAARDHLGTLSRYLSMLLPELGPAPEDADPVILAEAIIEAWIALARRAPLALFLDDLQWADNATLELLPPLAERLGAAPLIVLATYRSDDIARGHPVRRLRNELRRVHHLHEITIAPLEQSESADLLAHALGARPSDALAEIVYDKTQGIALYVEELANALTASGCVREAAGEMALVPGEAVPIPESIRDAVMLRLDVLSDAARTQLEIASVTGMEFSFELVTGLAGEEIGIEELIEKRLISEASPGRGTFRHALIREAIRGEIAWSRRRSLNRRIAAYLERAGAPPEQVVEHWLASGEQEPARRALLELADRSCRLHAYRDAARATHRALEIWPAGEEETKRLDALERLAHCAEVTGQLGDAARALREVIDCTRRAGAGRRHANALRALATVHALQGAWDQSIDARRAAADAFEAADAPSESAAEWLVVAGRYTSLGTLDHALETVRRAATLAAKAERTDLIVRAQGFEGNLLAMQGASEAGRDLAQRALSLALESNETEAAAEAYRRLASVLDYSSDFAGARDAYTTAVEFCRTQGDDANARVCIGCMSAIVHRTGDWSRALELSREVLDDVRSEPGSRVLALAITGLVRAMRGERRSARRHIDEAFAIAERIRFTIGRAITHYGLGVVAELEGDVESAVTHHDRALELWKETQDRHDMVSIFLWQSTTFARLGREHAAAARADALAAIASATGNAEAMAALAHALGEVALLSKDTTGAVQQLEQAQAQAAKLEIPLEQALTTWRLGTARARDGDRAGAARDLNAALRLARGLGARPIALWITSDLEALDGQRVTDSRGTGGAKGAGDATGALTARQSEIVVLIAEGLTNKEIAERLYLSPRTVDMHVRNILDRLDCRTRTEAARRAADLGMLG